MTSPTNARDNALVLKALHESPEILRVVNVWDAVSAKVIADLPGTKAIATAGHSIAASLGYDDGGMPLDVALNAARVIAEAVDLPVSADLDDGYDDPAETVRRAIGLGIAGANVEDRMRPFDEAVARVAAITAAAEREGVAFQLNARTDVFMRGSHLSTELKIAEAIARGKAFLDNGAALVFVPGGHHREVVEQLVAGIGRGKVSVIGVPPEALTAAEYEALGVARISYGPFTQRVALNALRELGADLYADGALPDGIPPLN